MGNGSVVDEFAPPPSIKDALAEQAKDYDCLPCRIMGSAAFTALGVYTYASGRSQLRAREKEILQSGSQFGIVARRWSTLALSAGLVGVGVYRLVN